MKVATTICIVLIYAFSLQCSASPGAAKLHSHANRSHQHSLPSEGVAHRHRGGALGKAISSGTPQANVKAPVWQLDKRCHPAHSSCNYCASNVQAQFAQAAAGKIHWQNKPWRFSWSNNYPPANKKPLDIFDGEPIMLGIPNEHVQGFVRTNSAKLPFAGSHSHKKQGGVFLVSQQQDGKKFLSSILPVVSRHPSGVHMLGKYLVYGEGRQLVFVDLDQPHQQALRLSVPSSKGQAPNFGGGIGLVQLSDGSHLVMLSGPGGQDKRPRFHRFYRLVIQGNIPHSLAFIGESSLNHPRQWDSKYAFSENLSLLKECGTQAIYAIHTTGDEKGIKALNGQGYWRLSKVDFSTTVPQVRPISVFNSQQNMSSCNVRASGTVYVNNQHQLELYCHAYAKDPDGSFMNILGSSSRNNDKFYFRVGVLR